MLNTDRLYELDFLDFLKYTKSYIDSLKHVNKFDTTIQAANNLVRIVRSRFVNEYKYDWNDFDTSWEGKNLNLSAKKLDHYKYNMSDKRKSEIISEFAKEYSIDLGEIIYRLEYKSKS